MNEIALRASKGTGASNTGQLFH